MSEFLASEGSESEEGAAVVFGGGSRPPTCVQPDSALAMAAAELESRRPGSMPQKANTKIVADIPFIRNKT